MFKALRTSFGLLNILNIVSGKYHIKPVLLFFQQSDIFLENNFKYQNANRYEIEGGILAKCGGFFPILCLCQEIPSAGVAPS